jgi:nucleotide-binding universal stress UspA family protein
MARIVVGVDGSPAARNACLFAAQEARMRDATLQLVHVRSPAPVPAGQASQLAQSEYLSAEMLGRLVERERENVEEVERHARQAADSLMASLVDGVDIDPAKVERTILVDRRPARRLVELVNERDDVDLLVVGSRGLGELGGMLLGSVSLACVTHARVPVTVVHG